jgi:CRISPR type III-A-associated protein Csm2
MKEKGGGGGRGAPPRQSGLLAQFDGYLKRLREQGYFNEQGHLRPELRVEEADMVARVLADAKVTNSQLRRFFTMSRSLEQRLDAGHSFDSIIADIASLQPFAANLIGKEQNAAQRDKLGVLLRFIDTNAQLARRNVQAFHKGFLPHFESVIAYFKYHQPKDRA